MCKSGHKTAWKDLEALVQNVSYLTNLMQKLRVETDPMGQVLFWDFSHCWLTLLSGNSLSPSFSPALSSEHSPAQSRFSCGGVPGQNRFEVLSFLQTSRNIIVQLQRWRCSQAPSGFHFQGPFTLSLIKDLWLGKGLKKIYVKSKSRESSDCISPLLTKYMIKFTCLGHQIWWKTLTPCLPNSKGGKGGAFV